MTDRSADDASMEWFAVLFEVFDCLVGLAPCADVVKLGNCPDLYWHEVGESVVLPLPMCIQVGSAKRVLGKDVCPNPAIEVPVALEGLFVAIHGLVFMKAKLADSGIIVSHDPSGILIAACILLEDRGSCRSIVASHILDEPVQIRRRTVGHALM